MTDCQDKTIFACTRYIIPVLEQFRSLLDRHGIKTIVPKEAAEAVECLAEDDIIPYAGKFDGVICADDAFTRKVLQKCAPRLKVISKWGTGIDSIDKAAAEELGIKIMNTPGAFTVPVAESTIGYILAFARRQPWMDNNVKANVWEKTKGRTLHESTLGVIGVGDIGKGVLTRAKAFGAKLLGYDIGEVDPGFIAECGVEIVKLEELLSRSDYVSINCDLNPTSHKLIDASRLALMKEDAVIVNTARGKIIDEAALTEALKSGRIGGAAMDVFETEPLPQQSELRKLNNVMLAPHNANTSPLFWQKVHINTFRNCLIGLGLPGDDPELSQ